MAVRSFRRTPLVAAAVLMLGAASCDDPPTAPTGGTTMAITAVTPESPVSSPTPQTVLVQGREPGPRHVPAGDGLRVAANDGVNHEFGRQVAAGGRDHRATDGELAVQLDPVLELGTAHGFQAAQSGGGRVEAGGSGTDDGVGGE